MGSPGDRLWAVVPAAGTGRRMGVETPKQYLPLAGATVLDISLRALLQAPAVVGVVVALRADDMHWKQSQFHADARVTAVAGGVERVDSVLAALHTLRGRVSDDDWIAVHDAARPCLGISDIDRVFDAARQNGQAALLGVPVADTIKRVANGVVVQTVDRADLWQAYTPQVSRYRLLVDAIESALDRGLRITDEASALEAHGVRPAIVEGRIENIKITRAGDLERAEQFLSREIS
ncbi:MAG: 2-C-methyl-D-erythritol 4-phosphate cytidylyltransferase [Chromatiales bacterium]|nr:2-C-methyl-D-erythritol 4-phosphate cytidylyltransferase [Chromatiales bacterium]